MRRPFTTIVPVQYSPSNWMFVSSIMCFMDNLNVQIEERTADCYRSMSLSDVWKLFRDSNIKVARTKPVSKSSMASFGFIV